MRPIEMRWIPVTEKQPECNGYYLVTRKRYSWVEIKYCIVDERGVWWDSKTEVIAWMPAPKLYKANEDDQIDDADDLTVDAEPVRHGRWLKDPHTQVGFPEFVYMMWKCSECGHSCGNVTPYCPWCGAKMHGKR